MGNEKWDLGEIAPSWGCKFTAVSLDFAELMKTREEKALAWIVGVLEKIEVPFVISGGLAARAYGSTRLLNDIDIEIPDDRVADVAAVVADYTVWGPEREEAECFELLILILAYGGQMIEICGGDSVRMLDHESGEWVDAATDFSKVERLRVMGIEVPVMAREELLAYKRLGAREVDLIDVAEISLAS